MVYYRDKFCIIFFSKVFNCIFVYIEIFLFLGINIVEWM